VTTWGHPFVWIMILVFGGLIVWITIDILREAERRRALAETKANRPPRERPAELPAILIQHGTSAFSRMGGLPQLPESHDWPLDSDGAPLAFLCQIALHELPVLARDFGYPEEGALFFFFRQDQMAWGFDPKHFGNWRAIYIPEVPSVVPRAPSAGLRADCIYRPVPLAFSTIVTRAYDEDEDDDGFEGMRHMMGGYPDAIQDPDMAEECELVSNGVYLGDAKGYHSAEAQALRQKPNDWILLLQLDSEEDAGMMWGDGGRLFFWIRRADLAKQDFSRVWMILQCY